MTSLQLRARHRVESALERVFGPERAHFVQVVVLLILRELKVKYAGSFLGYLWSMLNPLLTMLVVSFVFSHFVKGIPNYPVFVLSGIIFWNMTSQSLVLGTHSIVSNGSLMKKIKLPGWIFPSVALGTAMVNLILSLVPYSVLYFASGTRLKPSVFEFPIAFILFLGFLGGLILTLSVMNTFFRDVGHMLEPVLGLFFYATPLLYTRNSPAIPAGFSDLLLLNPFTHFIEALRATLYEGVPLSAVQLASMVGLTSASLAIGAFVYKKNKQKLIFQM